MGLNPREGVHVCLSLVSVVCRQIEVSETGRSLTECGVSECDREASIMRTPRLSKGSCVMEKKMYSQN